MSHKKGLGLGILSGLHQRVTSHFKDRDKQLTPVAQKYAAVNTDVAAE